MGLLLFFRNDGFEIAKCDTSFCFVFVWLCVEFVLLKQNELEYSFVRMTSSVSEL